MLFASLAALSGWPRTTHAFEHTTLSRDAAHAETPTRAFTDRLLTVAGACAASVRALRCLQRVANGAGACCTAPWRGLEKSIEGATEEATILDRPIGCATRLLLYGCFFETGAHTRRLEAEWVMSWLRGLMQLLLRAWASWVRVGRPGGSVCEVLEVEASACARE